MYCEHFGLQAPPFKITPDTQLFYSGGKRGLILNALIYAIQNGEGIIKVVGEVGSGKTMLCRMLEEKLPKQIEIVYLVNPHLSPEMILHAIAFELRLPVTSQSNRLEVMHQLQTTLLEKHALNRQIVIFVEEAQSMPLETLEEIRLLSNLETTRNKLLQIVLFGQPELDKNLTVTHIRQLKERITHSFYLPPFTQTEITEYITFRLYQVGYRGHPIFSRSAVRTLTRVSKGLIRRINILADKTLLAAFAENKHFVSSKHICQAAYDSDLKCWYFSPIRVILLLSLIFSIFMLWIWQSHPNYPILLTSNLPISTLTTETTIQQRLQSTKQWLNMANPKYYTIQVMLSKKNHQQELAKLLAKPEIQPLSSNLYLIDKKEKMEWILVYNEFTDFATASAALVTLPDLFQNNKPFVRTIGSLRDKLDY